MQAGLSLIRSHTLKTGFLMMWLICKDGESVRHLWMDGCFGALSSFNGSFGALCSFNGISVISEQR